MQTENVHLLVIEDRPANLNELLTWFREDFGYQNIDTATTTSKALEKIASSHFDVIISDMRVHEDSGSSFTILDSVQQHNLSSVVIVFTANETWQDCHRAWKLKAWDYISKNPDVGNAYENLHDSIQEAIVYLDRWGSQPNQQWFLEHRSELEDQYWGQWIAIANQTVIETADTETELEKRLEERRLRRFTVTLKQIGDFRPIKDLIQESEREDLEFKSSFQWDLRENKENKYLRISVLKTIAAFLNTQGGILLIGVEDNGSLFGLEADLSCLKTNPSLDQFERHLRQIIGNEIGVTFLPYLVMRFEQLEGKEICAVYVRSAPVPAFLKAKPSDADVTFFIRTGNETKALKVPEIYDYLSSDRNDRRCINEM